MVLCLRPHRWKDGSFRDKCSGVNIRHYHADGFSWIKLRHGMRMSRGVYKSKENNGKGKPFVGAIAVCNFSHVAFVIGKTKAGRIVLLGGNQSDSINLMTVGTGAVLYYMKPKGYKASSKLEELPILTISGGAMTHENTR